MLQTYAKKRNFNKTPEPSGKEKATTRGSLTFVIQKHSASRLHYDFRLECDGVLLSWAVPKGPSLDPAVKRLAVMVEDHPIAYGGFEGFIPAGQYGGGEVIVWDNGTYCPDSALDKKMSRSAQEKDMQDGLKKGKLSFTLFGKKLHGSWTLVRIRGSEKEWLLIKHTDEFVDTEHDITDKERSVLSKKTIASLEKINPDKKGKIKKLAKADKITTASKTVTKSKRTTKAVDKVATSVKKKTLLKRSDRSDRRQVSAPPLEDVKPMLASLSDRAFSKAGWIYEPKFDGIRAIAYIQNGQVTLKSRGGLNLNLRFPDLVKSLAKNADMIVDGEIVALDEEGRPSFQLLQARATTSKQPTRAKNVVYYIFDMLFDGHEALHDKLIDQPLAERKKILKKNLKTAQNVKYVDDLNCDGETAFKLCLEKGLEGIVAKNVAAPYQLGRRSSDWLKVKGTQSAEFVICGYTAGTGSRENTFGSLLLGHYKNKKLLYAGGVGTGFDQERIKSLLARLKPLVTKTSPFAEAVKGKGRPIWVEPKLVAEIKYHEWTADGRLRIPVFMRLREDINPKETGPVAKVDPAKVKPTKAKNPKAEILAAKEPVTKVSKAASSKSKSVATDVHTDLAQALATKGESLKLEVDGFTLSFSHLNKVLWPGKNGKGLTKRDYATYLLTVAPYILPHLKDRPLTLIRFPNGVDGQRFFQKHWEQNLPPFVKTFDHFAEHANENHRFLLCDNLATLLWLAQIADLELHTSHARIGLAAENKKLTQTYTDTLARIERSTLNYPDFLVLDLDPYIYSGKETKGEEPALNKKGFRRACKLALALKEMLDDLKMDSFVKTSGRTGLHIYVPMVRNIDYDQVRSIAATLGKHLLAEHPKDVTMDWAVVKRTGRIFFDHNMNARGKTLASIYSPRASQIGTVSTPVSWDELSTIYPDDFTLKTIPARLADVGDLWKDILDHKSDIKKILG